MAPFDNDPEARKAYLSLKVPMLDREIKEFDKAANRSAYSAWTLEIVYHYAAREVIIQEWVDVLNYLLGIDAFVLVQGEIT